MYNTCMYDDFVCVVVVVDKCLDGRVGGYSVIGMLADDIITARHYTKHKTHTAGSEVGQDTHTYMYSEIHIRTGGLQRGVDQQTVHRIRQVTCALLELNAEWMLFRLGRFAGRVGI